MFRLAQAVPLARVAHEHHRYPDVLERDVELLGLAFGSYPAMRAARLDPVEALRYE